MNILYIYGYGSNSHSETAKLIQEVFCHDTVFCIDYPQDDVRTAIELLQNFVDENRIELVIASSYGAFVALFLNNVVKILINPCMSPSVELPKIDADPQVVQSATEYEMKMNEIPNAIGLVTSDCFPTTTSCLESVIGKCSSSMGMFRRSVCADIRPIGICLKKNFFPVSVICSI